MKWFYKQGEQETGLISEATLRELHSCGVITNDTEIREEASETWAAFGEIVEDSGNGTTGIRFQCPGCGQKISAEAEDVGKQAT